MTLVEEAFAGLVKAESLGPARSWERFLRAAELLQAGKLAAVRKECGALLKNRGFAPAYALRALAAAGEGRWEEARADLIQAQSLRPAQSWPSALLASVMLTADDRPAERAALDDALAKSPSTLLYRESARCYEKLGMLPQAKKHAAEALRREPSSEHHRLLGEIHARMREYDEAVAQFGAALKQSPDDGDLLLERSKALAAGGRIREALRDADRLARRFPALENILLWREQLRALSGQPTRKSLAGFSGEFARAYRELATKRFPQARTRLERCAKLAGNPAERLRAGFYRALSDTLAVREEAGPARLVMAGLGVDPPHTATAEALRAISRCDAIFNNTAAENAEWLQLLCRDYRAISYQQEHDELAIARPMLAEIKRGRRVGFVTRGNALVYGYLGPILARLCANEDIAWRCLPSVSSSDLLETRFVSPGAAGALVLDALELRGSKKLETSVPATIYLQMHRIKPAEVCGDLERHYGPRRACLVLDHYVGQEPLRCTVGDLPELWKKFSPQAMLHLPEGRRLPFPAGSGAPLQVLDLGIAPNRHAAARAIQAEGELDKVYDAGPELERRAFADLKAGKTVGVKISGAPLRAQPEVLALIAKAAKAGIPWTVCGGVSATGVALSAVGATLGTALNGVQTYEASRLGNLKIEPSWALVLRFNDETAARDIAHARKRIVEAYGPQSRALWCRPDGRVESADLTAAPPGAVLYVPPTRPVRA